MAVCFDGMGAKTLPSLMLPQVGLCLDLLFLLLSWQSRSVSQHLTS